MSSGQWPAVLEHLRKWASRETGTISDAELLARFSTNREADAFAALMRRHGRMVWGVCRHVLRHDQDAEDAFQATFLVLARKAASIHKGAALASWLHGTAYHIATRARRDAATRRTHERKAEIMPTAEPISDTACREVLAILDEEVQRLSCRQRAAFVLCVLEGKSTVEAARALGWKEGTLSGTLSRAREQLRRRLARRGVTLSAILTGLALAGESNAPAALAERTFRAALAFAGGHAVATAVSAPVASLVREAIRSLTVTKLRLAAFVLATAVVAAGVVGFARQKAGDKKEMTANSPVGGTDQPKADGPAPKRTDRFGDPLPPGALVRMGTVRYAHGNSMAGYPVLAPDHKTFVTVSRQTPHRLGCVVCLWDCATGTERRHLDDPDFEPYAAFFLKSENRLVTLGVSRKPVHGNTHAYAMHFWDPTTGKKAPTSIQVLGYSFEPCALSPDERWLASASREPPVLVRDRKTSKVLAEWKGDGTRINHLAFSPDGKIVVICQGNTLHLWDWQGQRATRRLADSPESVERLWFSPDGRWIAAAIYKEGLRIWETKGLTEVRRIAGEYDSRFFPDGKRLVSTSTGLIRGVVSGKQVGRFENCAHCLALDFSADGRSATGYALGRIRCWDTDTGADRSPPVPTAHRMMIHQIGFLPDGKAVVSASPDGAIRVWHTATGEELRTLAQGEGWEPQSTLPTFMRVAPDGTVVAARGNHLLFFQGEGEAKEVTMTDSPANGLASLNTSADGKTLILAGGNRLVQLWDLPSRKPVARFPHPREPASNALGFLPTAGGSRRMSTKASLF